MDFDYWLNKIADAQSEGMLDDILRGMRIAEQNGELSEKDFDRLMIVHGIALMKLIYMKDAFALN